MSQTQVKSNSTLTTSSGSIEFNKNVGSTQMNLTHPSGSNTQYSDNGVSHFTSGTEQSLVLSDSFRTVYGDNSSYTSGFKEVRVEGDLIEFVGSSDLLTYKLTDKWFEGYNDLAALKSQFPDNRLSISDEEYPINSAFVLPSNSSNIKMCPDLLDGSAEDNKNQDTFNEFIDKMIKQGEEATEQLQQNLTSTYSNFASNAESYYNSTK